MVYHSETNLSLAHQMLGIESVHNARQLGGYRIGNQQIKQNLLLRSASLAKLSDVDAELLRSKYRVQRIYDFRSVTEAASAPDILPGEATYCSLGVSFISGNQISVPKFSSQQELVELLMKNAHRPEIQEMSRKLYDRILLEEDSQSAYRTFFADLLQQEPARGAVLWHCTQGKDRAGCASALLLAALGAPLQLIKDDFILSKAYYDPLFCKLPIHTPEQHLVVQTLLSANPQLFAQTLDKVEKRYGSLTAYLTHRLGVTEEMREQLRQHYLEPVCHQSHLHVSEEMNDSM